MHWTFAIRIVQLLFSFLVLCLCAAAIADFGSFNSLNFLLFSGLWAILCLVYLVIAPTRMPQFHHKFIALGLEFLCMIFFFAGFIALAADIGGADCSAIDSEFFSKLKTGCQCMQAATAFGAFSWLLFLVTLILVGRDVYMERSGSAQGRGPANMGGGKADNIQMNSAPISDPNL